MTPTVSIPGKPVHPIPPVVWCGAWCVLWCLGTAPAFAQSNLQDLEDATFQAAVARIAPSVVRIETVGGVERIGETSVAGPTTGLVVGAEGFILVSEFTLFQQPNAILVVTPGGKRLPAKTVAQDRSRMLALLKITTDETLVVPEAVPADEIRVGQWAIAVGRAFEEGRPNVSVGIISARDRIWGKAIQTDAKVSPNNYGGPLIDLEGRVLGVLTPLSPQPQELMSGAEWYDAGIGFAVPLADVNRRLDQLKQGESLHAGLLGISLKGDDPLLSPVEVVASPPKSPARLAGIKAGDQIVEADGMVVERVAHLRHALGRRYAGESVQLVLLRGEQRIPVKVDLVKELVPYESPALGLLSQRDLMPDKPGLAIRWVYPESGAAKAGLQAGDRLLEVADQKATDVTAVRNSLAELELGAKVKLKYARGDDAQETEVELGHLPTDIPGELPPAGPASADPNRAGETIAVKLPEEESECFAYLPKGYAAATPAGLLVYLHEPGSFDRDALVKRWSPICDKFGLILLAPRGADVQGWQPTEVAFIRKVVDEIVNKYSVDRNRIVVHGYQAGGALSYLMAFAHRDLVRGIAAVDGPLPGRVKLPENDPAYPLSVYSAVAKESGVNKPVTASVTRLQEAKFPVTVKTMDGPARNLDAAELNELGRWIDTLDRF